jgi:quinate dehydrogenase
VIEVFLQKESKGIMLEMCYNPRPHTELSEIASREGWQVILGTEAVLWQGIKQNRHWIGDNWKAKDSTVELVRDAVAAKLGEVPKKE